MTKLDKIIDNTSFRVPVGYFEQFNKDIMNCLPEKENRPTKTISMWGRVKPLLYIAAMFTGVYFSVTLLTNTERFNYVAEAQETTEESQSQWASVQISEREFFQFVEDQLAEFRFREILNHLQMN